MRKVGLDGETQWGIELPTWSFSLFPWHRPAARRAHARRDRAPDRRDATRVPGRRRLRDLGNIEAIAQRGATPYAPAPKPKNKEVDPHAPKRDDTPAVGAWRVRMGTEDAKRVYVQRGVLAERTNADLRVHRGLDRLNVRGLVKVKAVVLLAAISFNVMRLLANRLSA
jgi:hypothetical protein